MVVCTHLEEQQSSSRAPFYFLALEVCTQAHVARENFTFDTDLDFLFILLCKTLFEMEGVLVLNNQVLIDDSNKHLDA